MGGRATGFGEAPASVVLATRLLAVAGGIAMIIAFFLPWGTRSTSDTLGRRGDSQPVPSWEWVYSGFLASLLLIVGVVALAAVAMSYFRASSARAGAVLLAAGVVGLIVAVTCVQPAEARGGPGAEQFTEIDRVPGVVAVLGACSVLVAGLLVSEAVGGRLRRRLAEPPEIPRSS